MLAACSKECKDAKCTRCCSCKGVSPPGCRLNCSSRGEKACSTVGTGSVGSLEVNVSACCCLSMPGPLASRQQWHPTGWAGWPFSFLSLGPVFCFTFQGTLLNEMGFQLADQFPGFHFYVEKRRLGMGCIPSRHFSNDFLTHRL